MTIDIYDIGTNESQLQTYTAMIKRAQDTGRAVYIEETWRPAYYVPNPTQTPESVSSAGIGDGTYQAIDQKWLKAMTQFASTSGLEAITPFWTQTYFLYTQDSASGALDPAYNSRVATALASGQKTPTQQSVKSMSGNLGIKHITLSSASFQDGAIAADSIVTIFPYAGTVFSTASATADTLQPLPTRLAGVGVSIRDQAGVQRDALMVSVVPNQISCLLPSGLAPGAATVTVNGASGSSDGAVMIANHAPAIYAANQNGSGVAAAYITRNGGGGVQTEEFVFSLDPPGNRAAVPIDLGLATDQVVLSLYGTGLRRGVNPISVKIGGVDASVQFAGAQQQFPGLDQINVAIPHSLAGRGEVPVSVLAGGKYANLVTITIK